MKTITDIIYKSTLGLDLYLPETTHFPLFIYFHGGGLEKGDKASARHFAKDLTDCGIALASVNYSMYPEARYPDFLEDAADAIAFLKNHIGEYGSCDGLYVGGSSAGGYISMMLCFCPSYLEGAGMKTSDISGWLHDSGQPTKHFNVLRECGIDTRRVIIDETSALYWVGTSQEKPSPMLFLVSDNDMTNRYEQTQLMMSTLRHFGIGEDLATLQVLHGKHCEHVHKFTEDGHNVLGQIICGFIDEMRKAEIR